MAAKNTEKTLKDAIDKARKRLDKLTSAEAGEKETRFARKKLKRAQRALKTHVELMKSREAASKKKEKSE